MLACARRSRGPTTCESVANVLEAACHLSSTPRRFAADLDAYPDEPPPPCQGTTDHESGATVYRRFECVCGDRCVPTLCAAVVLAQSSCSGRAAILEVDGLHATVSFSREHGGISYRYSIATGQLVGVRHAGGAAFMDDELGDRAHGLDGSTKEDASASDAAPTESYYSYDYRAGEEGSDVDPLIQCRICGDQDLVSMRCDQHIWDATIQKPRQARSRR